jgi:hypothetical protein
MTNNIRILKNAISTITCTLPSGFTGTTLLTVSALEFENSVLFQVTGNTVNNNAVFVVSAADNNQIERVYFYQVTSGIISLAIGSYSIETSADIAPMPVINGQVNVNIASDYYDKPAINAYSASTLININSKLPILTFAAYTGSSLNNYYTKSQDDTLFVKFSGLTWSNLLNKPTLFDGAYNSLSGKPTLFSGSYTDLSNKPSLFSGSYIDLTNKPNLGVYLTGVSWSQVTSKPTLFSGAYSGLTGKPNLAIYLTGVTWSQVSSKPTLFDGAYASLSGKPTLFSGAYADLSGKPTLFTGNTFTASGGTRLRLVGNNLTIYSITGGTGGGGTWGSITGTLSSQTDLNTALGLKLIKTDFNTFSGTTLPTNYYNKTQINSYTGATTTAIGNRLLTSTYSTYTGATATAIGLKLAKTDFNTYSANTNNIFTNVTDTYLLARNGSVLTGVTQTKFNTTTAFNSYTGATATAIGNRLLTSTYSTYTGATLTLINGKLATAGCAADSAKFNNVLPAGYLLSGGTAKNSLCLNGHTEGNLSVSYATTAGGAPATDVSAWAKAGTKPSYTYTEVGALAAAGTACCAVIASCLAGVSIAGNANYATTAGAAPASDVCAWAKASVKPTYTASEVGALATAGTAADSSKLGGVLPAGYLLSGGTAKNSLCLGGALANTFAPINAPTFTGTVGGITAAMVGALATAGTATDSSKLGGVLPAGYLLSGGTAKNSLCLGGNLANTFAPLASPSFTTCTCAPIVCATTCFVGSGAGLTGTAAAFTVNNASCVNGHLEANLSVANSACLGGTLAASYALKTNAITGATNLGTGQAIYTSVAGNKIQLKSLKVLGGISITNDSTSITLSGGSTGGGGGTWGSITGTLSAQTDLQAALNSKSGTGHTHTTYQLKTDFNTYTGATATAIGLKLNTSAISAWALAGTKPSYTAAEVSAVATSAFNTYSGTTLPANYYSKTQINSYSGATNTLISNRLLTSSFNTYSGNTNTLISNRLLTSTYSTYTGATLTLINGKLSTTACAADSNKLNNVTAAGYLLSGGTAKNSLCLGGNLANTFASLTSPLFVTNACAPIFLGSTCICSPLVCASTSANALKFIENGTCLANTYLGCAATAVCATNAINSACLGGTLAACFAPKAAPTFTGTVVIPTPFTIGAISMTATGTELNYVAGVTSAIQTQLGTKAPLASPSFTTCTCAPIVCATTCFVGSGAGLTGTAASLTANNATCLGGNAAATYQNALITVNAQTASYTLVLTDAGKLVTMSNASANNLTIPLNSSVAYSVGTQITIISIGAGQTTIVATGGVTLNSAGAMKKLRVQYSSGTLIKTATDTWYLVGDLIT